MADAKVILKSENQIGAGLNSAKNDILGFGDAAKKVGDTIKSAFTVLAIIEGLKKLASVAGECFNEFAEGERRANQLRIALDNNVDSYNKNTELIGKMSKMTMASKDDVESLVTELATLGKSDKEIETITNAAVNLSNVTGKDLNTSFQMVNATMEGSTGKLGKLIPEMANLTKEQLQSGEAAQLINEKFGEMSEKLSDRNISQKLKNINDDIGDIKEGIGQVIAVEFGPLISKFGNFISESKDKIVTVFQTTVAVFENFPEVAKLSFKLVLDIIQATFSWNGLKTIFVSLAKYIGETLATAITSLPQLFWDVIKLMFTPVKTLGDYIADTLGKAIKFDFKNIQSPGDFLKNVITDTSKAAGKLVTDLVGVVGKQANNVKDLGVNLSHIYDNVDFKGFAQEVQNVIAPTMAKFESVSSTGVPALPSTTGPRETPTVETKPKKDINEGQYVTDADVAQYTALENLAWFNQQTTPKFDFDYTEFDKADAEALVALDKIAENIKAKDAENATWIAKFDQDDAANLAALDVIAENIKAKDAENATWIAKFDQDDAANLAALDVIAQNQKDAAMNKEFADLIAEDNQNWFIQYLPTEEESYRALTESLSDIYGRYDIDPLVGAVTNLTSGIDEFRETLGQSGITPSVKGGNGLNARGQVQAMEGSKSFFQKLSEDFKGVLIDIKSSASQVFSIENIKSMGLSGGDIMSALTGSFSQLLGAAGPLIQIFASANPLMAALLPIIQGAVDILGPAITEVISPLMNMLTTIGETLGIALLPILDAISPIFSILADILQTVVMPVIQMLSPSIELISLRFQILSPTLILVAKALTILMSPVRFIADLFSWLGKWISALGTNIGVFIYNLTHWFNPKDYVNGPGEFSSDAFTGLNDKLNAIDNIGQTNLAASATTSANAASQSASYSGSNQITINIYQQAPVVGDGGMTEFAKMIKAEFATLDYYNN